MNLEIFKKGKERENYTDYINQLNHNVKELHQEIILDNHYKDKIFMIGERNMIIKCHPYLQLNIIFEKQPYIAEISFEKKFFNLLTIKLNNDEAIQFIKNILYDELIMVEYRRILTFLFPSLFVKILKKDDYEKNKNKYLNHKSIKIYTGSKIIQ